ncbi:MAG: hypothetical protein NXI16_18305 [Alphaproteobacteria bacterium]|nr:hypothetical protein [Alphaproteobacteria bacterium]
MDYFVKTAWFFVALFLAVILYREGGIAPVIVLAVGAFLVGFVAMGVRYRASEEESS